MKKMKSVHIALIGALLLAAGSVSVWAQAAQQTGDQTKSDSSTATKGEKKKKAPAATPARSATASPAAAPAAPASAPAAKTPTTQQAPPAKSSGMVWVNTDSGVYHKPGTHWYGKTKQGKYMTEADAQKAGYHPAHKE